jgi:hypothetical protein
MIDVYSVLNTQDAQNAQFTFEGLQFELVAIRGQQLAEFHYQWAIGWLKVTGIAGGLLLLSYFGQKVVNKKHSLLHQVCTIGTKLGIAGVIVGLCGLGATGH